MLNLKLLSALYSASLQANGRFSIDDPVWEESRQLEARMKAFEASLTEEQKREFDDLIADHDHAREKGAFIIGFEQSYIILLVSRLFSAIIFVSSCLVTVFSEREF
ncbi:MAG: hypothetical protein GX893_06920 [Firmicutes bacterium]|nr:hypothetical protein [Bacillota bacterium]